MIKIVHDYIMHIKKHDLKVLLLTLAYPLIYAPFLHNTYSAPKFIFLAVFILINVKITNKLIYSNYTVKFSYLRLYLTNLLISSFLSNDIYYGIFGKPPFYTGFFTYLFCAFLFILSSDTKQPEIILKTLIASTAIVSLIGLMQYMGLLFNHEDYIAGGFVRIKSTIGNANWLASLLVMVIPGPILLFIKEKKTIWLVISSMIYACLLSSLTRGAWLSLFVIFVLIVVVLYLNKGIRKEFWMIFIVFIVVTLILLPMHDWSILRRVYTIPEAVGDISALEPEQAREEFFKQPRTVYYPETIDLWRRNWAFGVGPDQINIVLSNGAHRSKVHNAYLEIGTSMGIFTLIAYLLFISTFIKQQKNSFGFILLIMILAYMIQGVTIHDVISVYPLFWVVLGLMNAHENQNNHE